MGNDAPGAKSKFKRGLRQRHRGIAAGMEISVEDYRAAIREAWLPVVRRKKLTSFEYVLIAEWYAQQKPLKWVLEAIKDCANRGSGTLYSLGVIRNDLCRIEHQAARAAVGAGAGDGLYDWRAAHREELEELAESFSSPECQAMARELARDLVKLTEEQFYQRWRKIKDCR